MVYLRGQSYLINDEVDCIFSRFADGTKLGRTSDMQKVFAAIQKDLDRLENWAVWNLMKFDKGKCESLHLGRIIPIHWCILLTAQLGSPLAENAVGVLVDPILDMNQHCVLGAKKADSILGCLRHITGSMAR